MNISHLEQFISVENDRSSALRSILFALVSTLILLSSERVREIVSLEATLVAIGIGVLSGIVMSYVVDDVRHWDDRFASTSVGMLLAFGGAVIVFLVGMLIWVLTSGALIVVIPHFILAFIWSMTFTAVCRHLVLPTVSA